MKTKSIVALMFVLFALCVAAISCSKDNSSTPNDPNNTDNPTNTEDPNSPTDCVDPEDAIVVNLRNDGGSVTILDRPLEMNYANNFVCYDYTTIASVGEVPGLGCIESIPQLGWSSQVAVIPGNGYVLKYERYHESTGSITIKYARIYVVRYLFSATNEGILGAEIKYQDNWSDWFGIPPVVSTSIVAEITTTTAICGGNVTSDGGGTIIERGICWSTSEAPTINDNYANSGTGLGNYSIQMTNLAQNTRYYVRAYARNEIGLSYGEQNTFKTQLDIGGIDYSNIVLNELNGTDKFIEIYNMGNIPLPLEGMYIMKDDYAAGATWTADATVVVPAHSFVLLYSEDAIIDHPEHPEALMFHSGLSSKKTVRITLFMPDGSVRDEFTRGVTGVWGQTISNVGPQSFARTPDGGDWKLADPTPGVANPSFGQPIPQE